MSTNFQPEVTAVAVTEAAAKLIAKSEAPAPAVPFIKTPFDPAKEHSGPRIRKATHLDKVRALVPPRDHEPYVKLHAANVDALGLLGAAVFDYVADWYQPNAKTGKAKLKVQDCHGGYWVACSYADLKEQTGLKKRDAERGIADCVEAGVIETTVMKFGKGADRKPMLHIRISAANGQQILKGPLIVSPPAEKGPKHTGVLKNDSQAPMCASLGDQSTPGCFPNTSPTFASPTSSTTQDSVAASPATKAITANSSMPTGKTSQKPNQPPDAVVVPKIDNTPLKNGKRPLTFAREWEQLMREHHTFVPLIRDDCRKLKDARNKLYAAGEEKGFTPSSLLSSAFARWIDFACHARDEAGDGWVDQNPTVKFFIAHLSSVVTWHETKLKRLADEEARRAAMAKANAEHAAAMAAKASKQPAEDVPEWAAYLPTKPSSIAAMVQASAKYQQLQVTEPASVPADPCPCAAIPEVAEPVAEPVPEPVTVECPVVSLDTPVTPWDCDEYGYTRQEVLDGMKMKAMLESKKVA